MKRRFQSRRPRRFGRRGVRNVTENGSGRWERGELGFNVETVVNDDLTIDNLVISMGQITGHLGDTSTAATARSSVALESMARGLEIGGVVFDCGIVRNPQGSNGTPGLEDAGTAVRAGFCLVTDRLQSDGTPASIAASWGDASVPQGSPNLIAPGDSDEDFPMRLHWRRSTILDWRVNDALSTSIQQWQTPITTTQWFANLRLRKRLPDTQGLFMHVWWNRLGFPAPAERDFVLNFWLAGSIYYRVKF